MLLVKLPYYTNSSLEKLSLQSQPLVSPFGRSNVTAFICYSLLAINARPSVLESAIIACVNEFLFFSLLVYTIISEAANTSSIPHSWFVSFTCSQKMDSSHHLCLFCFILSYIFKKTELPSYKKTHHSMWLTKIK